MCYDTEHIKKSNKNQSLELGNENYNVGLNFHSLKLNCLICFVLLYNNYSSLYGKQLQLLVRRDQLVSPPPPWSSSSSPPPSSKGLESLVLLLMFI